MSKETFEDEKGTFHYEPVVWGDWNIGDKVVFEGFTSGHNHWSFIEGYTYTVGVCGSNMGPVSNKGEIPLEEFGFKFSRKVYNVVENVDNTNVKAEEKNWYEYPQDYPPINSIVLAEYNSVKDEYFKAKILSHDTDAEGRGVLIMWLEGPSASITQKKYNASYFKPIITEKKWNEYPFSFPPVRTLALVEFDTARAEWYKGYILSHGVDEEGGYCEFEWSDGPKKNQTAYYYTPQSFKSLSPVENKEEKDQPKQEKSLDNLLKEFHNLKQEEKELSDKIAGVIKDINQRLDGCGLAVVYKEDL